MYFCFTIFTRFAAYSVIYVYIYVFIFAYIFITSVRTRRARSLPAWILFCKASNTILALPHAFCLTSLSLSLSLCLTLLELPLFTFA